MSQSSVAIIVAFHKTRTELNAFEEISYRRLWSLYGRGDIPIILVAPSWLDTSEYLAEHSSLRIERFEFRTCRDYNQMLMQTHFFERFKEFRHILIHDLDCYILRDELLEWCERPYDYIGAPLFHGFHPPNPEGKLWCVGNSGFSLRNVKAALKVLTSQKRYVTVRQYWARNPPPPAPLEKAKRFCRGLLRLTRVHNDVRWATLCNFHEDIFWSVDAAHFSPEFRLPDVETGLRFSFDYAPAYCYEQAGFRLPFGCHDWPRYDLAFWKKFIPEAAEVPSS